jgi:hypothetical protein
MLVRAGGLGITSCDFNRQQLLTKEVWGHHAFALAISASVVFQRSS